MSASGLRAEPDAPAVSVVLPVRNGQATIGEAVASVLAQTRGDLELIVVDDGSTDGTREVLAAVSDRRLRMLSTPGLGPAASRNRGIEHAAANTIAFIDADDVWLPEKLETQLAALDANAVAAVAYCWTDYVDEAGGYVCPDSRPVFDRDVYEQLLTRNFIDSGSNVVVRKRALLDVGCFDESLPVVEDWDLYIRLAARHAFVCAPVVLVHYRLSAASLTTRIRLMETAFWRVVDRAFAEAPESLQRLKRQSIALFYEYLVGKATQGCPSRSNGLTAVRFFAMAVARRPASLVDLWRRPWITKALAKAALSIVLPARAMRRLARSARPSAASRGVSRRGFAEPVMEERSPF